MKYEPQDVGSKVWFMGHEVTITTEPYGLYGGMFQDAENVYGELVTIAVAADTTPQAK